MLVRSGEARTPSTDRRLAWSLACTAGALNTAGFYAVGLYSSNMTGNVSALANQIALGNVLAAIGYLSLVLCFVFGATTSTLLITVGQRHHVERIYALSILLEAALLGTLALADLTLCGSRHDLLLAYGLSFLMGLQNAVVTRISNARVRTTHVTGMVTDIGIELGNLIDAGWHRRKMRSAQNTYSLEKFWLHGATVASFFAGGIAGVLAYRTWGAYFLFGASLWLLIFAVHGLASGADVNDASHRQHK